MKKLFIIGSGGFSKQVIEMVEKINEIKEIYELVGLIDDNKELIGQEILGYKIIGTTDYLNEVSKKKEIYGVIAIADGKIRANLVRKLNSVKWVNLIHPKAIVSKYVKLGEGNIICAGVIVNPMSSIGNHCHINIGSTLGHDVNMSDFVTVMPGCRISGNVVLKKYSMLGAGSIVLQGLTVEENVSIGAGAVVTKNTVSNKVYVGVPARILK